MFEIRARKKTCGDSAALELAIAFAWEPAAPCILPSIFIFWRLYITAGTPALEACEVATREMCLPVGNRSVSVGMRPGTQCPVQASPNCCVFFVFPLFFFFFFCFFLLFYPWLSSLTAYAEINFFFFSPRLVTAIPRLQYSTFQVRGTVRSVVGQTKILAEKPSLRRKGCTGS